MKTRKRILFIAEAVTLAHVARPFVLAQSSNADDFEVHFACADRYEFVFRDAKFTRHSIESITPDRFIQALANGTPIYDYNTLESYVEADKRLLEQIRPDMVVGDFRLSLAVSAAIRHVPYATITNAHWSPYTTRKRFPFPEHPLGRILGPRLPGALFSLVQPFVFRLHARPFNKLRKKYGLRRLDGLQQVYTHADHVLYADIPSLAPTKGLPSNHHYLGPILWSPEVPVPEWWDKLGHDMPVVYVSLGSSGQVNILPVVIEALARMPVTVILATAGRLQLGDLPNNFFVSDFVPGRIAAQRAAAVICSGGSAPVYQALNEGTPVLGIPSNMDQHLTMSAVERACAGVSLRSESLEVARVERALSKLIDDGVHRDRSKVLAREIADRNATILFRKFLRGLSRDEATSSNSTFDADVDAKQAVPRVVDR